ncbi:hypothetical protein T07_14329 [Trichinella nelsoni]|uniref:Uncharacterized protein n=1 Tax=Trichinella nelsoni TaxID=6336 RepID=A0A0V0RIK4_9BILA|nr:hypothetical protein T07_14329 [Trichinella nelsoni]
MSGQQVMDREGVGRDTILIILWEYGGQGFNTKLLLDGCGSGAPLLVHVGWSSKKRHDREYILKEDGQRKPNYMYKDAGWASQHWHVCNTELVLEGCGEAGWATRPYTTINALWDEWSAGIEKLIGDAKANTTLHQLSNFEWVVQCCELKKDYVWIVSGGQVGRAHGCVFYSVYVVKKYGEHFYKTGATWVWVGVPLLMSGAWSGRKGHECE